MLNINISNKEYKLEIKGHANFAKYGKDIVCSAVSTIIIFSINLIDRKNKIDKINYKLDEGYLFLKVMDITDNDIINIYNNIIDTFKDIANSYPKNLKITEDN